MGKKKIIQHSSSDSSSEKMAKQSASLRSRKKKLVKYDSVRVYISSSYNNTKITLTDEKGSVLAWASAGSLGFGGPRKATPFAASKVVSVISEKLHAMEVKELSIFIKGIGGGRDSSVRSLANQGFIITSLRDVTPIPHNGPRPAKVRRV